jgi:hypothetical protein
MGLYLAARGGGDVGFTIVGDPNAKAPRFIRGERGAVERQTARYYFAIEAHLRALVAPRDQRFEKSLGFWFAANERYPRQLHEMRYEKYVAMKRREYARQQALQ